MDKETAKAVNAMLIKICEAEKLTLYEFKEQSKTFYFRFTAYHHPTEFVHKKEKHVLPPFKSTISSVVLQDGRVHFHCHLSYDAVEHFLSYYTEYPPGDFRAE